MKKRDIIKISVFLLIFLSNLSFRVDDTALVLNENVAFLSGESVSVSRINASMETVCGRMNRDNVARVFGEEWAKELSKNEDWATIIFFLKDNISVPEDIRNKAIAIYRLANQKALSTHISGLDDESVIKALSFEEELKKILFEYDETRHESNRLEVIKKDFSLINPHINGVVDVSLVQSYLSAKRLAGRVENRKAWMIHCAAQVVISTLPYHSANKFIFNAMRANEHAALLMSNALDRFFTKYPHLAGTMKIGEGERYGVPALLTSGVLFNYANKNPEFVIDLITDVLEGSDAITYMNDDNSSSSGTVIGMAKEGSVKSFPDDTYYNKIIARVRSRNGARIDVSLDRPIADILEDVADALGKEVSDLNVGMLWRDRHRGDYFRKLLDAGVSVDSTDHDHIKEQTVKSGIFKNGNLYCFSRNDFFPFIGMLEGELDLLIGVGRPSEAETLMLLSSLLGGNMKGRFASYSNLTDRGEVVSFKSNEQNFSPLERRILRDFFKENPDFPGVRGDSLKDKLRSSMEPYNIDDMGIAAGFAADCYWNKNIQHPVFDPVSGYITVDVFWAGASGEVEIYRVTYKTNIPDLRNALENADSSKEKASLYIELARTFLAFKDFDNALKAADRAVYFSDRGSADLLDLSVKLRRTIMLHEAFVSGSSKAEAIANVEDFVSRMDIKDLSKEEKRLLRRFYNQLGDEYRGLAEHDFYSVLMSNDPLPMKAVDLFAQCEEYYAKALELFDEDDELVERVVPLEGDFSLKRIRSEEKRRTLLERSLVEMHRQIIKHKLEHREFKQDFFSILATMYRDIAKVYKKNGYNLRSVAYEERAMDMDEVVCAHFGGILPIDTAKKMGHIYEENQLHEQAMIRYARIIDPKRGFKLFSPKLQTDEAKEMFISGVQYSSFATAVFPLYIRNMYLHLTDDQARVAYVEKKARQWLKINEKRFFDWLERDLVFSDDYGVLFVKTTKGNVSVYDLLFHDTEFARKETDIAALETIKVVSRESGIKVEYAGYSDLFHYEPIIKKAVSVFLDKYYSFFSRQDLEDVEIVVSSGAKGDAYMTAGKIVIPESLFPGVNPDDEGVIDRLISTGILAKNLVNNTSLFDSIFYDVQKRSDWIVNDFLKQYPDTDRSILLQVIRRLYWETKVNLMRAGILGVGSDDIDKQDAGYFMLNEKLSVEFLQRYTVMNSLNAVKGQFRFDEHDHIDVSDHLRDYLSSNIDCFWGMLKDLFAEMEAHVFRYSFGEQWRIAENVAYNSVGEGNLLQDSIKKIVENKPLNKRPEISVYFSDEIEGTDISRVLENLFLRCRYIGLKVNVVDRLRYADLVIAEIEDVPVTDKPVFVFSRNENIRAAEVSLFRTFFFALVSSSLVSDYNINIDFSKLPLSVVNVYGNKCSFTDDIRSAFSSDIRNELLERIHRKAA